MINKEFLKDLTYRITGAAIEVHKFLGPGLLESIYQKCMKHELKQRKITFRSELLVPVRFKEIELDTEIRCDLFVEDSIVVELKACEGILPVHEAQILTYMKLLNAPKGILINFNVVNLYKEGQRTFVSELFRSLPDN